MRKKIMIFLAILFSLGFAVPIHATQQQVVHFNYSGHSAYSTHWETAMESALDWIKSSAQAGPRVGAAVGEWAVLAMTRAERVDISDPWVQAWLTDLHNVMTEIDDIAAATGASINTPPSAGTFPTDMRRWTDFQRVTLALSALGLDASDTMGWDITAPFSTYIPTAQRHALNRTILADIFALVALTSQGRNGDAFLSHILDVQRDDGSWSLDPNRPASVLDLDITAMALQALAPFYRASDRTVTESVTASVIEAVQDALAWLTTQEVPDPEGAAQIIVALTALGPGYASQAEYYVDLLLTWFDPTTGGFRRPTLADPVNHLATVQAAYALVAYSRFVNGLSPLFDMYGDFDELTVLPLRELPQESTGLPGKHPDVNVPAVIHPGRMFTDIQGHENQRAIEALATRGIISGRSGNRFEPDATITRAEFAAIITNGLGLPAKPLVPFEDVPATAWFAEAVGTAYYYGIISGVSATRFNPRGNLTRQEAALMITRAAGLCGMDTNLTEIETLNILAMFGDYRSAAGWAWDGLAFCYREGILDDYEFYIRPRDAITRGEVAQMLYLLLTRAALI